MTTSYEREIGAMQSDIKNIKEKVDAQGKVLDEIESKVDQLTGAWKLLIIISSAISGGITLALSFFFGK